MLVASVYPVLIGLGVSRLTALSVIAAATLFDQGPGSANTALAAELIDQTNVAYFITHQLPLVIPTTLVVMTLFYFNNRYFDKKEAARQSAENSETAEVPQTSAKPDIPLIFAMLPILPLALLIVFSPYVGLPASHNAQYNDRHAIFPLCLTRIRRLPHTQYTENL